MRYKCIDQWLETGDPIKEIIQNSDEKNIPIIQFIYRAYSLRDNFGKSNDLEKLAYELLNNYNSDTGDIRAYFLFLNLWSAIICSKGRGKEAQAIFNRLEAIKSKGLPLELISNRMRLKGLILSLVYGDKSGREKCIKDSIEILPDTSKLKYLALSEYAVFLAQSYRYVEIRDQVEVYTVQKNCPKHILDWLISAKLIHFNLTGQGAKAKELQEHFNKKLEGGLAISSNKLFQHLAEMAENKFLIQEKSFSPSLNSHYGIHELMDISTHYLAYGDAAESLLWAKKLIDEYGNPIETIGFASYVLIRAELSNQNERSARVQLLEKSNKGGYSFLDDFFWTRVELLAGNFNSALDYFKRVLEACEYYEVKNVLENEILLAVELKAVDLHRLYQALKKKKSNGSKSLVKKKINKLDTLTGIQKLIGESQASKSLKLQIKKFASLKSSILIIGETGVGKDVVARALHEESDRAKEPFLVINCGAINESLLQSELFGHVAGAYTGAEKAHKGIFEAAGNGTVFLDEIGEISSGLQVALLRVLEAGEIRPVGSAKTKPFHARILAATNAPLEKLVDEGNFRMDLLYRLKKLVLQIQPLRERPNDILALTQYFFEEQNLDGQSPTLSIRLLNAFKEFDWPGNVRELKNEVERMRLLHSEKLEYDVEDSFLLNEKKSEIKKIKRTSAIFDKDQELENIRSDNKINKRLEEIKDFFRKHQSLTRNEISKVMRISLATATTDLKKLLKEDFIEKIEPSPSPRSHYFVLKIGM